MLLGTLASGCARRASTEASAPGSPSDDLTALEQQLAQREDQLRGIGVAPPMPTTPDDPRSESSRDNVADAADASAATTASPSAPEVQSKSSKSELAGDRCEQVCEISTAICMLEQQICGLLPRHQGDPRYQNACDRSVADCRAANEACHACTAN